MTTKQMRTEMEQEAIKSKNYYSPLFSGWAWRVDMVIKRGLSLEQIFEKATQEWLDKGAEEMDYIRLTVDEFREYAVWRYTYISNKQGR